MKATTQQTWDACQRLLAMIGAARLSPNTTFAVDDRTYKNAETLIAAMGRWFIRCEQTPTGKCIYGFSDEDRLDLRFELNLTRKRDPFTRDN